jgi:thiamine transport system substrate-binding protein
MLRKYSFIVLILASLAVLAVITSACAEATASPTTTVEPSIPTQSGQRTLTVMTHDSFAASDDVIRAFESAYDVVVRILPSGDAGTALNKAILSKGNPIADVFYGVDNTFLSRALSEDIFEPYQSPMLANISAVFILDPQNRALPVDYGDVCPNYDKAYFAEQGVPPPRNLEDLTKPEYKGLLVVENPATSSPGMAFLLATIGRFGADGYLDYWQALVDNDVLVVNDWDTAYYTEFSTHGGTRPIAISYGSSPPAEVVFAETPIEEPPTSVVTTGKSCFRQIEFVGILKGTQSRDLAERWVDYMLDLTFQQDMPLQMFVYPVNKEAKLPEEFIKFAATPNETSEIGPDEIAANREAWLQAWTETVLR